MSSIVLGSHSSSEDRTTAFVGELSLNGQWLWAETVHGTSHRDWILAQSSVSDDSNVWLAGDYQWNIQFGGINVSSSDQILSSEGFIGMYNRTSSSWTEVATLNGGYYDFIRDIKLFPNGDALVVGGFCGLGPTSEGCNATTGQHNLSSVGAGDVFVGRLKPDGTWAGVRPGGSQG